MKYIVNEKNYAPDWLAEKGYHPIVFDTYGHCKEYFEEEDFSDLKFTEIWKCEIPELITIDKPFLFIYALKNFKIKIAEVKDFYTGDDKHILNFYEKNLKFPKNSYFAKYVIPVEKYVMGK